MSPFIPLLQRLESLSSHLLERTWALLAANKTFEVGHYPAILVLWTTFTENRNVGNALFMLMPRLLIREKSMVLNSKTIYILVAHTLSEHSQSYI